MNKRFVSLRLIREGMSQVKLVGIIGVILMSVASCGSAFIAGVSMGERNTAVPYTMDMYQANPYIYLVMYLIVPIMALMLFGFMNKRRASDFYHSIPYTRVCIFLSFLLSVLLWAAVIIAVGTAFTMLVMALLPGVRLEMADTVRNSLGAFSGAVLVACVMCFAMTLTGTYFTNVLVAVMILFAPRGFITLYTMMLHEALPFVIFESGSVLLNSSSNIVFGLIYQSFFGGGSCLIGWQPVVYTFAVGLLYGAAAGGMFLVRKSENATRASVNRGLQCFLRVIPAMLISLIPIGIIFNIHVGTQQMSSSRRFDIIISYIAAVVVYFVFEAVTTRKLRNVVRAIPGLLIVAAVNAVFILGLCFHYDYHLKAVPDASELSYVTIGGPQNDAFWSQTAQVRLYSDEAKAVASDCLKDTVKKWNNQRYGSNGFYNSFYSGDCMIMEYHYTDGKTITRKVIVDQNRYGQLKAALSGEEEFVRKFCSLFREAENTGCDMDGLDRTEAEEVYHTFLSEVKGYDFGRLLDMLSTDGSEALMGINMYQSAGSGMEGYSYLNIGINMPHTLAAYANAINRKYAGNEMITFSEKTREIAELAEKEDFLPDDAYMDFQLDLYLYHIGEDGQLRENNYYISSYMNGSEGWFPDQEGRELLDSVAGSLQAGQTFRAEDFAPGSYILVVRYWEYNSVMEYHYEEGAQYAEGTSTVIAEDYGWYLVDEETAQKVRNISGINHTYY